jgi:iron complex transport system substrate-binding protein
MLRTRGYQRIVCLTEETTETIYLLGEQARIVGISGYTVRPPEARKEKPRVSAFTSANMGKIAALAPDLVLGFSDLQADIAAGLVRAGLDVHIFNQRSIIEILRMIETVGVFVDRTEEARTLADTYGKRLDAMRAESARSTCKPRVYFEEWGEPMISGIRWVSELIEIAGGTDCFAELSFAPDAKGRIIADPQEVVRRAPDIIVGSWCGRRFPIAQIAKRSGWQDIPAVRAERIYEIKSPEILQPGPAALTDGLDRLLSFIEAWKRDHGV